MFCSGNSHRRVQRPARLRCSCCRSSGRCSNRGSSCRPPRGSPSRPGAQCSPRQVLWTGSGARRSPRRQRRCPRWGGGRCLPGRLALPRATWRRRQQGRAAHRPYTCYVRPRRRHPDSPKAPALLGGLQPSTHAMWPRAACPSHRCPGARLPGQSSCHRASQAPPPCSHRPPKGAPAGQGTWAASLRSRARCRRPNWPEASRRGGTDSRQAHLRWIFRGTKAQPELAASWRRVAAGPPQWRSARRHSRSALPS